MFYIYKDSVIIRRTELNTYYGGVHPVKFVDVKTLEATLNPVSIINLTNLFAWAIDLGTGKCCKWDTDVVEIEMEKSEREK